MSNLNDIPSEAPPSGVTSNLVDPSSKAYWVTITWVVCLTLSTLFVLIRMYTRIFITKPVRWDDYTCIIAWLGLYAFAVIDIETIKYGAGVDEWNVSVAHTTYFGKWAYAGEILYSLLIFITKLSILLLYLRIFVPQKTQKGKIYIAIQITIWLNFLLCLAFFLVEIFGCTPRQKYWKPWLPGPCVDVYGVIITSSVFNCISDLGMLLIPMFAVFRLRMHLIEKLGLLTVFAMGTLAFVTSIARLILSIIGSKTPNQTVALTNLGLWGVAEVTSGLIASCMPLSPAFFRHFKVKILARGSAAGNNLKYLKRSQNSAASGAESHATNSGNEKRSVHPNMLQNVYVELNDIEPHRSTNLVYGTTATVRADRTGSAGDWSEALRTQLCGSIIQKSTVEVESHPKTRGADRLP
ncbi:MAG: hypothetical protein MMC33_009569 [Icmadophila ericetorum]|nr:hypothetical protein [Icmadophila ericetorum]